MSVKTPPKPGRYKEQRIIAGTLHNVITENGKVVKDLGAAKKDPILEQEQPIVVEKPNVVEEKPRIGIPLISEDGSYVDPSRQAEEAIDNNLTRPNVASQEQKPKFGVHLTPVSLEDLGNIVKQEKQEKQEKQNSVEPIPKKKFGKRPEWEDILNSLPEPDPDRQNPPEPIMEDKSEPLKDSIPEATKAYVPIIDQKSLQIPKVTIPKVQINIPPKNEPIKLENIPPKNEHIKLENIANKLGDIITTDTYPKLKETEVVEPSIQKANENNWPQQPVTTREKPTKEKRRSMSEELEAELLDERKFEQWMKKQKFHENLEKAAQFAEQTKEQLEEKIPELSNKIEDVTGEVKGVDNKLGTFSSNVDNRFGTVDKSIGTLCTGIDCVKEDVKKYQTSHDSLEKLVQERFGDVQERFGELSEKVQSLERPTFTCENCGEPVIAPLSSYCPNCGSEIQSWSNEDGQPVIGWTPYWKRIGRSTSQ
jgi:hypothetical protein